MSEGHGKVGGRLGQGLTRLGPFRLVFLDQGRSSVMDHQGDQSVQRYKIIILVSVDFDHFLCITKLLITNRVNNPRGLNILLSGLL